MYCRYDKADIGGVCLACGHTLFRKYDRQPLRVCESLEPTCEHLGNEVKSDGVTIRVKCNCAKGELAARYDVYSCNAPQNIRPSGKPGRCLPTMRNEFDEDHQAEARLYSLCFNCPIRIS